MSREGGALEPVQPGGGESGRRRRFCFVLPQIHFEFSGGAETQCYFLARELLRRGWEVHYIREADEKTSQTIEGIRVHALPRQRKLFKWRNSGALRRTMASVKADYWYVRANTSYLPLVVAHARSVGGKTLWAFSRDTQLAWDHKRVRGRPVYNAAARLDQWRFFRALRRADGILLQTEDQQKTLARTRRLAGEVIYNAHPLPPAQPAAQRQDLVVWIGRLQDFKHPERFIELARQLSDTPLSFQLVGAAENPARGAALARLARNVPNLRLRGRLPLEEVHELLDAAKLLVNTSDYEGFSNTFIEAWARGVPVLSLHVDPDRLITRECAGYVEGDLAAAAARIRELAGDGDTWQKLSANGLRLARDRFNIVDAVNRLEAVLPPRL
jgi:glycosyltransferase involved in cell wall biosynthesis